MADVRDILELDRSATPELTKEAILGNAEKQKKKLLMQSTPKIPKRPEGMHREVFALLYNDNKDAPPLFPTDTGNYASNSYEFSDLNVTNTVLLYILF